MPPYFTIQDIERSAVAGINKNAFVEKRSYDFLVGIDCGVNTGICLYNIKSKKIEVIETCKIHIAMLKLQSWAKAMNCFVRFEDARLRKWIPKQATESAERGRREGAGSVKRDAVIWHDWLEYLNIPYEAVAPKNNKTKVSDTYFKQLTGYQGKTSKHSRDAAMLVIGY